MISIKRKKKWKKRWSHCDCLEQWWIGDECLCTVLAARMQSLFLSIRQLKCNSSCFFHKVFLAMILDNERRLFLANVSWVFISLYERITKFNQLGTWERATSRYLLLINRFVIFLGGGGGQWIARNLQARKYNITRDSIISWKLSLVFAYIVANCLNTRGTSKRILRNQSVIEGRCEVNLQIEALLASHCSSKDILIDNFIILSKSTRPDGVCIWARSPAHFWMSWSSRCTTVRHCALLRHRYTWLSSRCIGDRWRAPRARKVRLLVDSGVATWFKFSPKSIELVPWDFRSPQIR